MLEARLSELKANASRRTEEKAAREAEEVAAIAKEEKEIDLLLKKQNSRGLTTKGEQRLNELQAKATKRAEKKASQEAEHMMPDTTASNLWGVSHNSGSSVSLNENKGSEFALLDAFDPLWRENFGQDLTNMGIEDDFIEGNQEFVVDYLNQMQSELIQEEKERAAQEATEAEIIAKEEEELAELIDKRANSLTGLSYRANRRLDELQANANKRAAREAEKQAEQVALEAAAEVAAIAEEEKEMPDLQHKREKSGKLSTKNRE